MGYLFPSLFHQNERERDSPFHLFTFIQDLMFIKKKKKSFIIPVSSLCCTLAINWDTTEIPSSSQSRSKSSRTARFEKSFYKIRQVSLAVLTDILFVLLSAVGGSQRKTIGNACVQVSYQQIRYFALALVLILES